MTPSSSGGELPAQLASELSQFPLFERLSDDDRLAIATAADVVRYRAGELILDAFATEVTKVYVVLSGRVWLWSDPSTLGLQADEIVKPGDMFGYSAMLSGRSVGPRAVAAEDARLLEVPDRAAAIAFASRPGARFLADSSIQGGRPKMPSLGLVDDLLRPPLLVESTATAAEAARLITDKHQTCGVVQLKPGKFGMITDASLRRRVIAEGVPGSAPVGEVLADATPIARLGESAGEVLIRMFDSDADALAVVDPDGQLRGMVTMRDFALAPTSADRTLRDKIRTCTSVDSLIDRARHVPWLIDDLHSRGLSADMTIAVFSTFIDAVTRRAIALVFEEHPDLPVDRFTWMSLGSNGRREAVLSSDVDSAVAFPNDTAQEEIDRYRAVFAQVQEVLATAGLVADSHGASAAQAPFARTNAQWRAAARQWIRTPLVNQGIIMTSLLVDGRPIYGDLGLPAVAKVFRDLREHPGTMRLLLQDSLADRPKRRATKQTLLRRSPEFNLKKDALLPIVNLGRWSALAVGSPVLPTVERLRTAAGSSMMPDEHASVLIEVFQVLQALRLRYQLAEFRRGRDLSDVKAVEDMSPIDRTVVAQAVREIRAIQRRVANIAVFTDPDGWTKPEKA